MKEPVSYHGFPARLRTRLPWNLFKAKQILMNGKEMSHWQSALASFYSEGRKRHSTRTKKERDKV